MFCCKHNIITLDSNYVCDTIFPISFFFFELSFEMYKSNPVYVFPELHEPMFVRLLSPPHNGQSVYRAGPAQFGYDLSTKPSVSLPVCLPACLTACLPTCLYNCLLVCFAFLFACVYNSTSDSK